MCCGSERTVPARLKTSAPRIWIFIVLSIVEKFVFVDGPKVVGVTGTYKSSHGDIYIVDVG
jgi:hypothetical protein